MSKFFICSSDVEDNYATIRGDDAFHIARSLRMAVGEEIILCDESSREYRCVLRTIRDTEVTAEIVETFLNCTELPCGVRLYQSLAKGEKMDYIVQKAVELGVQSVVPVASSRCVLKLDGKSAETKLNRWQKIADNAATQSGRGIKPKILSPLSFANALEDAKKQCDVTLFCYEGEGTDSLKKHLKSCLSSSAFTEEDRLPVIGVFVGPEGGYSAEEFSLSKKEGALPTGLGKRILRCETASGFVLSCIAYQTEL